MIYGNVFLDSFLSSEYITTIDGDTCLNTKRPAVYITSSNERPCNERWNQIGERASGTCGLVTRLTIKKMARVLAEAGTAGCLNSLKAKVVADVHCRFSRRQAALSVLWGLLDAPHCVRNQRGTALLFRGSVTV